MIFRFRAGTSVAGVPVGAVLFGPLLLGVVLLGVLLAGCSGDGADGGDGGLPEFASTGTANATTTGTPPASSGLEDDELPEPGSTLGVPDNAIVAGTLATGTGEQVDVQLAYLRFWVERARALHAAEVDQDALSAVATGPAADGVVDTTRELADRQRHAEGGSTVNVRSVKVSAGSAQLVDCFSDRSVTVNSAGRPVEPPDLAPHPFRVTIVKTAADGWRVRELKAAKASSCLLTAPAE